MDTRAAPDGAYDALELAQIIPDYEEFEAESLESSLRSLEVDVDVLQQPVSQLDKAFAKASGDCKHTTAVRSSTVFCRKGCRVGGCRVMAMPLGGAGGVKGSYRYAFHCSLCHDSWSQLRPEDVRNDPAYGETKKRPKKCACVASEETRANTVESAIRNAAVTLANVDSMFSSMPCAEAVEVPRVVVDASPIVVAPPPTPPPAPPPTRCSAALLARPLLMAATT